ENMEEIKKMFPKSTWFGFTGTPIFPENRKQAKGNWHVRPMISMERSCTPIPSRMH
ncbi:type I restriction modification site-specific deoxyribonuclease HsdR, partial [Enterococcus faecium]